MITTIAYKNQKYTVDLSKPLDISIPLIASDTNVNAWYIDAPKIEPVIDGKWIGQVAKGASTNFNNITFNPHGHGTHTECVGHITPEFYSINAVLKQFFFKTEIISITPTKRGNDKVITKDLIKNALISKDCNALVIRTLPNQDNKLNQQYSHTNWPYLTEEAAKFIRETGIEHLLIDLPSVDKEKDDGKLLAHKAFWDYPNAIRYHATITELIYVNNNITDGVYLLNLQIAPFENDAAPSKPILYKILDK